MTTDAQRRRAYWVAVAVAAMTILDLSKVYVALPTMAAGLGADSTALQLVVSGYALTFGLALVPAGRLGDQWSRRTLMIAGVAVFTLASIVCALAPGPVVLVAARLVQGVGAGILMPQVVGIVQMLFTGASRARALGTLGATVAVATAFGPSVGGVLVQLGGPLEGWRAVFWMNVPVGVLVLIAVVRVLPRRQSTAGAPLPSLDPVAVVVFGGAVVCLMWPFLLTTGSADDDPARWWALPGAVALLTVFVVWERRYERSGRAPLIPMSLLSIASFRNGVLVGAGYFMAVPGMLLVTTVFLQSGLGVAPVFAGLVGIGFALMASVGSWLGGRLVSRFGRPLVLTGLLTLLIAVVALAVVGRTVPPAVAGFVIAAVLSLAGLGAGFVVSPNQALTLLDVRADSGGLAGSVSQLGQRVGTTIGTASALSLFYATAALADHGESGVVDFQTGYAAGLAGVAAAVVWALLFGLLDLRSRRHSA